MPRVSVVLPAFNRLRFLEQAVASVHAQTFDDWELLIADDGSGEQTRAWLRGIEGGRVRVLRLAHSGNPSSVRNAAITAARGPLVAFLDSDDVWAANKLAIQVDALERRRARWSYTACERIDADGRRIAEMADVARVPRDGAIFAALLELRAAIAMPSVLAERSLLAEIGGFDEAQRFGEFHDLCLRLALRAEVAGVRETLCSVRAHDEHFSADRLAAHADWLRLYEKMLALAPTAELRRSCRRMRARMALRLAQSQGARGDLPAAWRALHGGAVFSWPHVALWPGGLVALARSCAPGARP
jgi:glycosyltransferase involved in cell wall biosynthesis